MTYSNQNRSQQRITTTDAASRNSSFTRPAVPYGSSQAGGPAAFAYATPVQPRWKAPRRSRAKSTICAATKKYRFRDLEEAKDFLWTAENSRRLHGASSRRREQRAYYCGHCCGHHVTSQQDRPSVPPGEVREGGDGLGAHH